MRKKLSALYHLAVSILLCAVVLLPILYIAQLSFRSMEDVTKNTLFFTPTLQNYVNIFSETVNYLPFLAVLKNSVIVTLAIFVPYLKEQLPPIAIVVPLYMIWAKLGLYDSLTGLILPFVALDIPLSTWLMEGFFKGIPENLEEAASIDGCTRFQAFRKVILPLTAPGIAATSIFSFSLS